MQDWPGRQHWLARLVLTGRPRRRRGMTGRGEVDREANSAPAR
jgi:hypothetical protein